MHNTEKKKKPQTCYKCNCTTKSNFLLLLYYYALNIIWKASKEHVLAKSWTYKWYFSLATLFPAINPLLNLAAFFIQMKIMCIFTTTTNDNGSEHKGF